MTIGVLREKEQRSQADLLDVQPYKDVLQCFWGKSRSESVARDCWSCQRNGYLYGGKKREDVTADDEGEDGVRDGNVSRRIV